ncbi:hypothetical protein MILUP08_30215 [Micromonospora lupini str. Lupac 08]|uniref:Uncharacterized protein n=1 Tax=Micromonospora lupini str. Lupac 08 TaxID=1150864 RepID=I0LE43_9ACTN|nr:hypothetical protein MILUP08_30215 [Micromonospora lupini str. Lupac 08]
MDNFSAPQSLLPSYASEALGRASRDRRDREGGPWLVCPGTGGRCLEVAVSRETGWPNQGPCDGSFRAEEQESPYAPSVRRCRLGGNEGCLGST